LDRIALLPDQGVAWYYWKLPHTTIRTRLSVWGLYLLHQLSSFALIYYAQTRIKRYTPGLHPFNLLALGVNALFIFFHLIQTHIFYDGLAQDVSIFSSQGSVIVLLVWVLLMENNRRGMFFGQKLPIGQEVIRFARKYHGYYFSWAVIYTFWYHPMVSTTGHLIGVFYTMLLLLQSSLMFSRIHTNRYWTVTLEVLVLIHGTLVAIMQAGMDGFWPMFFFGFLSMFVITQMHGLGLNHLWRWLIFAAYLASMLVIYNWRGWSNLNEVIRIPIIDYLSVIILALLFWLGLFITGLFKKRSQAV
ncbi:MAG: hypothetical protein R2865_17690, partial [Deinococcales bacterium]